MISPISTIPTGGSGDLSPDRLANPFSTPPSIEAVLARDPAAPQTDSPDGQAPSCPAPDPSAVARFQEALALHEDLATEATALLQSGGSAVPQEASAPSPAAENLLATISAFHGISTQLESAPPLALPAAPAAPVQQEVIPAAPLPSPTSSLQPAAPKAPSAEAVTSVLQLAAPKAPSAEEATTRSAPAFPAAPMSPAPTSKQVLQAAAPAAQNAAPSPPTPAPQRRRNVVPEEAPTAAPAQPQTMPFSAAQQIGAAEVSPVRLEPTAPVATPAAVVRAAFEPAVEAVAEAIQVSSDLATRGEGEIRIQLKPAVLDGSAVQISVSGSDMAVTFHPATPDVAALLQSHAPELAVLLSERVPAWHATVHVSKRNEHA